MRQVLEEWLEYREPLAGKGARALWVCRTGGRLSARSADRDVRAVAAAAGLVLSAHTLRYTCLTALVRKGNDLVMVADLAGHQKLETTRRYTLPSEADRQAAVDAGDGVRLAGDRLEVLAHDASAADPAAREFGYSRGVLTVLNWTSDHYSQYGTKVVSVAEREAVHTLEAILHSRLEIREHTTDTHCATEHVFALFDLLGLSFIPRLKNAGELRLHRLGPSTGLPDDTILRGRARPARIREHYDDLLRAAASLKRG